MSATEEYTVRDITKDDIPTVIRMVEKYFFPEEVILQSLIANTAGVTTDEQREELKTDRENHISAVMSLYPCQAAVYESSGDIAGANLMITSERPNAKIANRSVDVYTAYPAKTRILNDYFRHMNDMIDAAELFARYPEVERAIELYTIVVDESHRKKGLSTALIRAAVGYAKENGIDLVFGLFTSPFSRRAAEKVGFTSIFEIDLLKYRDSRGELIFQNCGSHSVASVMVILTNAADK